MAILIIENYRICRCQKKKLCKTGITNILHKIGKQGAGQNFLIA